MHPSHGRYLITLTIVLVVTVEGLSHQLNDAKRDNQKLLDELEADKRRSADALDDLKSVIRKLQVGVPDQCGIRPPLIHCDLILDSILPDLLV